MNVVDKLNFPEIFGMAFVAVCVATIVYFAIMIFFKKGKK